MCGLPLSFPHLYPFSIIHSNWFKFKKARIFLWWSFPFFFALFRSEMESQWICNGILAVVRVSNLLKCIFPPYHNDQQAFEGSMGRQTASKHKQILEQIRSSWCLDEFELYCYFFLVSFHSFNPFFSEEKVACNFSNFEKKFDFKYFIAKINKMPKLVLKFFCHTKEKRKKIPTVDDFN